LPLFPKLAKQACARLGPARQVAQSILRVSLAGIERALRRVTVERGHGTHGMALVPFGGAGGVLACDLAELLDLQTILVPREPGLLCALGMLHTPASRDLSRTLLLAEGTQTFSDATRAATELEHRALKQLKACGLKGPFKTHASLDVRYVGQSFELNVPLKQDWKRRFETEHDRQFYFSRDKAPAEIVNVRVRVEAKQRAPRLPGITARGKAKPTGKSGSAPVYARESLAAGAKLKGPAIVTELSSCLYVKKGWSLQVTKSGQLKLTRGKSKHIA
jgi:N-methylhydantoinase A/oxoprolinase/acetone carboxylase beta subunit